MKWFIKCLKHYADFSGRARRKEYWMFVLFNVIFAFAWVLLIMLLFAATGSGNKDLPIATNVAYFSYLMVVMLPGMAVAVRRLHDIGKSGWMILVAFIPLVGGIWLLILMLVDGEPGENRYGPNPKTSAESFSEQAKLKSAGIVLIVAAIAMISMNIMNMMMLVMFQGISLYTETRFMVYEIPRFVALMMLLIAGIFLLDEKQIYVMQKKGRNAMTLLFVAISIFLILAIVGGISNIKYASIGVRTIIGSFINISFFLSVTLFAAFILSSSQNKNLIRNAAIWLIVFSGLDLLWCIYVRMGGLNLYIYEQIGWSPVIERIFTLDTLFPIAFMVLAGTFLSSTNSDSALHQPVTNCTPQPPPVKTPGQGFYERDNRGMRVDNMQQSTSYWLVERMNNSRKDPFVYYVFKNGSDARAALLELPFIHEAADTGKLICNELFRFGYFAVTSDGQLTGEYDAFVAGADFTHDMWEKTHAAFAAHNGTKRNDLEPDKDTDSHSPSSAGNAQNVTFVRENKDGVSTWMTYQAPSKVDAMAFLSQQQITRALYYVVVETPEGNFGKDKDGFYQE